jgi:hypothetical protein
VNAINIFKAEEVPVNFGAVDAKGNDGGGGWLYEEGGFDFDSEVFEVFWICPASAFTFPHTSSRIHIN